MKIRNLTTMIRLTVIKTLIIHDVYKIIWFNMGTPIKKLKKSIKFRKKWLIKIQIANNTFKMLIYIVGYTKNDNSY